MTLCGTDLGKSGDHILARLGIVFQQQTLDLDLTVAQNLSQSTPLCTDCPIRPPVPRMAAALAKLDLADRTQEKVRKLSGGHRRRVEIARVLLTVPSLLLDEPTVGLDISGRLKLVAFLHRLAAEENIGICGRPT